MAYMGGIDSVATDHGLQVQTQSVHGQADDNRIDAWELQASRRALANLRELLIGQPMFDLINNQIEEHDAQFREYVAKSDSQWSECYVVLNASGSTLEDLLPVIGQAVQVIFGGSPEERRNYILGQLFPMHPEHYAFLDGVAGGIETMGGSPSRCLLFREENPPQWITKLKDPSYPLAPVGRSTLLDGTPHTWTLQQFKDTSARGGSQPARLVSGRLPNCLR